MTIYVESNFVLELALLQEQHESCRRVVSACSTGRAQLALPAFCIAETYEALGRRSQERGRLGGELKREIKQLSRSKSYQREAQGLPDVDALLDRSAREDAIRLRRALKQILRVAEIIPLNASVLVPSPRFPALSPQDSIVCFSVLHHLKGSADAPACFLTRNRSAFEGRALRDALARRGCKLFLDFAHGWQYIAHEIGRT